jgi:hypothetical protein
VQRRSQSCCSCGRGEPSPGTDVAGVGPVPEQMWPGEPSPGADVDKATCRSAAAKQHSSTVPDGTLKLRRSLSDAASHNLIVPSCTAGCTVGCTAGGAS